MIYTTAHIPFIGSSRTDKSKLRNQNSGWVVPWQGVRGGRVQGIEKHGIFRSEGLRTERKLHNVRAVS